MEPITEETANALNEQFLKANSQFKIAANGFADLAKQISNLVLMQLMEAQVVNVEKFYKASFITRWYWRKRMNKYQKAIDEYVDLMKQP